MNSGTVWAGTDKFTSMTFGNANHAGDKGAISRAEIEVQMLIERRIDRIGRQNDEQRVAVRREHARPLQWRYCWPHLVDFQRRRAGPDAPKAIAPSGASRCRQSRRAKARRRSAPAARDSFATRNSVTGPEEERRLWSDTGIDVEVASRHFRSFKQPAAGETWVIKYNYSVRASAPSACFNSPHGV